jgi:hypothetical protein
VLLVLLKTNQYNTNTIGKNKAKDNELKNMNNCNDDDLVLFYWFFY